jgi:hypothetical protein
MVEVYTSSIRYRKRPLIDGMFPLIRSLELWKYNPRPIIPLYLFFLISDKSILMRKQGQHI